MNIQPSFAAFSAVTSSRLTPLCLTLPVDTETPVSLYRKLVGDACGFILESAVPGKNFGRYSILGRDPHARLTSYRDYTQLEDDSGSRHQNGAPLCALREFIGQHRLDGLDSLPLFAGGAVGYLAYEATATWERIRNLTPQPDQVLAEWMSCRDLAVFDHLEHAVTFIHLTERTADAESDYRRGSIALKQLAALLDQPLPPETILPLSRPLAPFNAASDDAFCANVRRAQEHIAAGDAFQIVLSSEQRHPLSSPPFSLYRSLRRVNPSPYMFYLNFGERQVLGASPERLVKLSGNEVSTHPIAGTRPRGANVAENDRLAAELAADPKELAEHAMLVDLGRNDIGKISRPGSVQVTRWMEVENFSHVMHLVSEVCGTLNDGFDAVDALQACFPAGTVSGAPKARVMEIIRDLEGDTRGIYAGAVGYFDFRGNMDTCIAIRTLAIENNEIILRAGAGIVADSVPSSELKEVLHKSQALHSALEGVQR